MTFPSPSKKAPLDLAQLSHSPSAAPSYFPESHRWSEISSLSKKVLGKARSHRAPNLGCRGAESPGWICCFTKTLCTRHDTSAGTLWWCAAFWIIRIVSTEKCSSLLQNLTQICCSTRSVILNETATQYTWPLNGIYHPHWLVQWSHHCSHMRIPVHCAWLPGYISVTRNFLIVLTMAGLFPGRPHNFNLVFWVSLSKYLEL